jgi:acetyl-CoA carboxylase beta subunit
MEKPNLKMLSAPELENQRERIGDLLYGFCFIGGSMGAVVGENRKRN